MSYSNAEIWALIAVIGLGTYLIRFSFLGLIGDRELPPVLRRLLRYTPVAVIPGLVAPQIVSVGGGAPDPVRLLAAAATIAVGWRTKRLLPAILAGALVFFGLKYVSGA